MEYDGVGAYDMDHGQSRVAVQVRFRGVEVLQDAPQDDVASRRWCKVDSVVSHPGHSRRDFGDSLVVSAGNRGPAVLATSASGNESRTPTNSSNSTGSVVAASIRPG